jgi:hypothetical protein
MTKKRRALHITLYAIGIAVSVSLIYIFRYDANVYHILRELLGEYHPHLPALISMPADFLIGGCIGFIVVNFALRDDITQHFPWLQRKQPRIILYTLGVTAALYCLYPLASLYFPFSSLLSGSYWGIPLGLAMMFTAGCAGFAIVSLLLRDYAEQSIPSLKRKPLLIGFYILSTIGGLGLVGSPLYGYYWDWGMSFAGTLWLLPMLVIGGCIGLATMSIVLRDDLTEHFTFLRRKGFRTAFYTISIASGCWVLVYLIISMVFLLIIYILPVVITIGGCIGFAAASIILRGNLKRTLSITGIIVGVGTVIIMLEVGIMFLDYFLTYYPG